MADSRRCPESSAPPTKKPRSSAEASLSSQVIESHIPSDLIQHILCYVPPRPLLRRVSLVSRKWRTLALRAITSWCITKQNVARLEKMTSLFPNLTSLDLDGICNLSNVTIPSSLRRLALSNLPWREEVILPNLTSLTSVSLGSSGYWLPSIMQPSRTSLTSITFSDVPVYAKHLWSMYFPSLSSLRLPLDYFYPQDDTQAIASFVHLHADHLVSLHWNYIDAIAFPKLRNISMLLSNSTFPLFCQLKCNPTITSVDLVATARVFSGLKKAEGLITSVQLQRDFDQENFDSYAVDVVSTLHSCRQLTSLSTHGSLLNATYNIPDDFPSPVWNRLRKLTLEDATAEQLPTLASCMQLVSLQISPIRSLLSSHIALSFTLPHLEELRYEDRTWKVAQQPVHAVCEEVLALSRIAPLLDSIECVAIACHHRCEPAILRDVVKEAAGRRVTRFRLNGRPML